MKAASSVTHSSRDQQFVSSEYEAGLRLLFVRCILVINRILGGKYFLQPGYIFWRKKRCWWADQLKMAVVICTAGQHRRRTFEIDLAHRWRDVAKGKADSAILRAVRVRGVEHPAMMERWHSPKYGKVPVREYQQIAP